MIHPMWATFMKVMLTSVYNGNNPLAEESKDEFRSRIARTAGAYADYACAEYDKRDKAEGGSPYRS